MTNTINSPRQLEIVEAATRVFAEHGYRGSRLQLIAEEAGLSQAGLIHHFPNKDAILLAVIEHRERENAELFQESVEQSASAVDTYRCALRKNAQRPELMRLFAVLSAEALSADHPAHDFFVDRYRRVVAATAELVRTNQADGVVRDDVPADVIAQLIVAAADGLRYQYLIDGDPTEQWAHFETLETMFAPPTADVDASNGALANAGNETSDRRPR